MYTQLSNTPLFLKHQYILAFSKVEHIIKT